MDRSFMPPNPIEAVSRLLPLRGARRRTIERELRAHLRESQRELELAGWTAEDAAQESARRLGDPTEIAAQFGEVYRPSMRKRIVLPLGLGAALVLGGYGFGSSLASATPAHHSGVTHHHQVHKTHHRTR